MKREMSVADSDRSVTIEFDYEAERREFERWWWKRGHEGFRKWLKEVEEKQEAKTCTSH